MEKNKIIVISGLISIAFILLTGWFAFNSQIPVLFEFSFIFHLVPFAIGFSEGMSFGFYAYYIILWIVLYLISAAILRIRFSNKEK
jgi:hypothetical protein